MEKSTAKQLYKMQTGIYMEEDDDYIYSEGAHLSDLGLQKKALQ